MAETPDYDSIRPDFSRSKPVLTWYEHIRQRGEEIADKYGLTDDERYFVVDMVLHAQAEITRLTEQCLILRAYIDGAREFGTPKRTDPL